MPWIAGIDEAGYGPNLGPFVMTVVACRVPEALTTADLWTVFEKVARRHGEETDSRFVVADSKLVYAQHSGLAALEKTALAAAEIARGLPLADLLALVAPASCRQLVDETWYTGKTELPVEAGQSACAESAAQHRALCQALGIHWGPVAAAIVCPAAFNAVLDRCHTKGAVLAAALQQLLRALPSDDDDVFVYIDKHGGRNSYAAVLQPAFDDGLVLARAEGSLCSRYEVQSGGRQWDLSFAPRADGNHFCVALASMVSKYLREVMMLEFNQFWQRQVKGLLPTAGYPMDARRFWREIERTVKKMALDVDTVWRRQ